MTRATFLSIIREFQLALSSWSYRLRIRARARARAGLWLVDSCDPGGRSGRNELSRRGSATLHDGTSKCSPSEMTLRIELMMM